MLFVIRNLHKILSIICDFRENWRRIGRAFEITFPLITWDLMTCLLGYGTVCSGIHKQYFVAGL